MDLSVIFLLLYISLWIYTYVQYQRKRVYVCLDGKPKRFCDSGSILLLSYIMYAILSTILYSLPAFKGEFKPLHLIPFLYLFLMLRLAMRPVLNYNQLKIEKIIQPNLNLLTIVSLVIIISTFIKLYGDFTNIQTGISRLVLEETAGMEMYDESREIMAKSGSTISNFAAIISNIFSDFAPFILCYYLTLPKEKVNKILMLGLIVVVFSFLITPLIGGQRGGVIFNLFTILMAYFSFNKFIPTNYKRKFSLLAIVAISFSMFLFTMLTISRFGYQDEDETKYSVFSYAGQQNLNFNNYCLDAGGIRYGDRTANLFKRVIDPSTPKNYVERRQKYKNLKIDDYSFYTFVGDFTLDYGPIVAFFLFVVFSQIFVEYTRLKRKMPFYKVLAVFFPMCVCMQGGIALFTYSDTAGLRMLAFLFLIILFKYIPANSKQIVFK